MRRTARPLPFLALVALALAGASCAKSAPGPARPTPAPVAAVEPAAPEAPPCTDVAAHIIAVMRDSDEMKSAPPAERKAAESMLQDLERHTVTQCTDEQWSARVRRCIFASPRLEDMKKCEPKPGEGHEGTADLPAPADVAAPPADAEKTASGLASKVLRAGTGARRPAYQDQVKVHYTGWTTDGKMFDSSITRGHPVTLPLRGVIPGWTEGVQLMKVGEKRRIWIPEQLAYDAKPGMPAGMLVFDVELLEIIPGPKPIPAPASVGVAPANAKREKSGVAWTITKKGSGKRRPSPTAHATFHFTAWTTAGLMLHTTHETRPRNLPIDKGPAALTEMLPQMLPGEKRLVWAPDGLEDRPGSKPGEIIVFELELISFLEPPTTPKDVAAPPKDAQKTESGLYSKVLVRGKGKLHPTADDTVLVHYSGWTTDGKIFDSSVARGEPARFPLGAVIRGWTEGVQLMTVGEKRRLWIPEELAYEGKEGAPAGTLVFDIELIAINPLPAPVEDAEPDHGE